MSHPNMVASYKARKIDEINKQMVNEFHPAVKSVALAGQNLVRVYEGVNKAFYLYTASLYGLSHSGKYAEKEAREHAAQLQRTAESLKLIYSEHSKWVDYFANVIAVINHNNESEKERLKTLGQAYAKKEKRLVKMVDKGKMAQTDLDSFYESQLAMAVDQQFQRYKFFSECHQDLLKKHFDWSKFSVDTLEKHLLLEGEGEEEVVDPEHEQSHLDELYQHAEEQQQRINSEVDSAQQPKTVLSSNSSERPHQQQHQSSLDYQQAEDMALDIYYDRLKAAKEQVIHPGSTSQENRGGQRDSQTNGRVHEKSKSPRSLRKEFEQRSSSHGSSSPRFSHRQMSHTKSNGSEGSKRSGEVVQEYQPKLIVVATDNEGQFILKPHSETNHGDMAELKEEEDGSERESSVQPPCKVLLSKIYKATPIVALMQQQNQQQVAKRSSYVEKVPSNKEYLPDSSYTAGIHNRRSVNLPPNQQTTDGDQLSSIYQQFKEVQQKQRQVERTPTPYILPSRRSEGSRFCALRLSHPTPTAQKPSRVVSAASSSDGSVGVHARDRSQGGGSTSRTSSANRMSHPLFSTSDYGQLLECVNPYSGQGDNQLSLRVGQKVILVKCGTRGWVLGRSEDGGTQGWFPAKFLKLI